MKITKLVVLLFVLGFALAACKPKVKPIPTAEATLEIANTAVPATMTAQVVEPTSTVTHTPPPTFTLTPPTIATMTPTTTPTRVAVLPTAANVGSLCDDSLFLSDVTIPDGKTMAPGQSFTKTWALKNTGTCGWTTAYTVAFVSGEAMSGKATKLEASVSSGKSGQVSVKMVAPTTFGTYTGFWKLKNAAGNFFGQTFYVQIVVSSSAATLTPTPSKTPIATATKTSLATAGPTATQTLMPTGGPTGTATPTSTTEPTTTPTLTPTNTSMPTVTPTDTQVPTLEPTLTPTGGP